MSKITVITPTVRVEGLDLVAKALRRQTFKNFEWLIISPLDLEYEQADRILKDPPKRDGDYWSFNKAHNLAIRESKGELIVSAQDYTFFDPECLEKFWFHFSNSDGRVLISAVGDKYSDETFTTKIWNDPRKRTDFGTFYECYPNDVEFNLCAVPKKAFYEVGGFDEYLDKFAGMDHISVQERLDQIGYKFYLDQTNESYSLHHGRLPEWDKNHAMHGGYQGRKQKLISDGVWPVLAYLDINDYNSDNKSAEEEPL